MQYPTLSIKPARSDSYRIFAYFFKKKWRRGFKTVISNTFSFGEKRGVVGASKEYKWE